MSETKYSLWKEEYPPKGKRVSNERYNKAIGDSDGFSFCEHIESREGVCDDCGLWSNLTFQAEKEIGRFFFCEKCGKQIKRRLEAFELSADLWKKRKKNNTGEKK